MGLFIDLVIRLPTSTELREQTILPAQRVSRLKEPTADEFDMEFEDEWAQSQGDKSSV